MMTTDFNSATDNGSTEASGILWVDDEPEACKWFARCLGNEFTVFTAHGVDQALEVLRAHAQKIALVVTDFRMPQRDGLELLRLVQQDYSSMVGLLASAYAERDVAIAAVNEGQVFRILEKPLSEETTRTALREALALYRQRTRGLALQQNYSAALRETLGFVAHELATPLSTVRGYMDVLRSRLLVNADTDPVATALNAVERSALHCQSLMSTFVQSARDAYPGAVPQAVSAASLVDVLLHEYPFEASERDRVSSCVERDFMLPGQRDLLYFVLCTLTKNALHFLRDRPNGQLTVRVGCDKTQDGERPWMKFEDNGPGIEPELLNRLTHGPVSTRSGGSGMGLVFARRVVQSLGGSIELRSELGRGTTVVLYFQPSDGNSCAEEIR